MYKVFCNDSELLFASINENWEGNKYYKKEKVFRNKLPCANNISGTTRIIDTSGAVDHALIGAFGTTKN